MYDIIIIGGGPAGISAGIYAVSRGKKTLIIEKSQIGGIIGKVSTVTHYSAIVENESGATFAERLKRQALHAGVEIRYENVIKTELQGDIKTVMTEEGCYQAQKLILANGSTPRKLDIPGEAGPDRKGNGAERRQGRRSLCRKKYVCGGRRRRCGKRSPLSVPVCQNGNYHPF